ncbi:MULTISPECIES: hypothetical protein [Methylomonas]|uniref:hypothetical protein n=1 Tax=Methylomonas TaxID=416 RepID=UPI0016810DAA|nr:hypothetical protein [Methylomonas rhizoryzae]
MDLHKAPIKSAIFGDKKLISQIIYGQAARWATARIGLTPISTTESAASIALH